MTSCLFLNKRKSHTGVSIGCTIVNSVIQVIHQRTNCGWTPVDFFISLFVRVTCATLQGVAALRGDLSDGTSMQTEGAVAVIGARNCMGFHGVF